MWKKIVMMMDVIKGNGIVIRKKENRLDVHCGRNIDKPMMVNSLATVLRESL